MKGEIEVRLKSEKEEEVKIKLIFLNLIANLEVDFEKAMEPRWVMKE